MRAANSQAGFSFPEVLVLLVLIALAMSGMADTLVLGAKLRRTEASSAEIGAAFDRVQKIVGTEWSCTASLAGNAASLPIVLKDPINPARAIATEGDRPSSFWQVSAIRLRDVAEVHGRSGVLSGTLYLEATKEMSAQLGSPVVARSIRNLLFATDPAGNITRCYPGSDAQASAESACHELGGNWVRNKPFGSQCVRVNRGRPSPEPSPSPSPSPAPSQAPAQLADICLDSSAAVIALPEASAGFGGNARIEGDVFLLDFARLEMVGNARVEGEIYQADGAVLQVSQNASAGGASRADLSALSEAIAALDSAQAGLAVTLELEEISGDRLISSQGPLNVVSVSGDLALSGDEALVLEGGADDVFVVNVVGKITVTGNGSIRLQGGLLARNVLFNNIGRGKEILLSGNGSVAGTFLALQRGAEVSGDGRFEGSVIAGGGVGTKVTVTGNGRVMQPRPFCPGSS